MSVAGGFELLAWILSAVIAGWLLVDMARVSRRYSEEALINPTQHMGEAREGTDE